MPNWAEGNIRFRGKRENLITFMKNEICSVVTDANDYCKIEPVKYEEDPSGWTCRLIKKPESEYSLYFKDSRRQFIDGDNIAYDVLELSFSEGPSVNKDQTIIVDHFKGAWGVDEEIFKQYAMKYKIDIRICVWECGLQWSQIVTFYKTGSVDSDYRSYSDWLWDSPMPFTGG